MATLRTFYVVSIKFGNVLSLPPRASSTHVVLERKGKRNDEQKWTVEKGDEPDLVALKNVANGKYLCLTEQKDYASMKTGDKQWWRITNDGMFAPGSIRFIPVDFPKCSIYFGSSYSEEHSISISSFSVSFHIVIM